MARTGWRTRLATGWCLVVAVLSATVVMYSGGDEFLWPLALIAFTAAGAFIVRHHPRNAVGWLLLVPGVAILDVVASVVVDAVPAAPPTGPVGAGLLVALWLSNFAWVFVFLPTIIVLALFPTGRPVSPAWRWQPVLAVVMTSLLLVGGTFADVVGPLEVAWVVDNPIGFLPPLDAWPLFMPVWNAGLVVLTLASLASMVVRRRRAGPVERLQLTWLFYAVCVFAAVYVPTVVLSGELESWVIDVGFVGSLLFIPTAIGIAVVRHNLLDIVVVVRRTVVYVLVLGVLGATYVGSVLAFESLARGVSGADGSLGVAASTLLVAGLANPLRLRVHRLAARRFFRVGYDAELVGAAFARGVRDPTDVDRVAELLQDAAAGALQPSHARLLLVRAQGG